MGLTEWFFGKSMTPQERLKKTERRESLKHKKKKLIADVKKSAKNGQIDAAKIQAKDLVRTRNYIQKFDNMKAQLQAISLRIQAVRSSDQMTRSMREATGLLAGMNRSMNLPQLQKISMEFEKQSDLMDQRQEFMDEAIDNVMGDELEENEDADEIVNKVLDEIGVDLNSQLQNTPQHELKLPGEAESQNRVAETVGASGSGGDTKMSPDDDLQARLDSLKRQ
ncbi:probable DOA4-independent degradation protein 4 [Nakaseomyces glabratus]|nr:probable DOA4-independent degradation protein 4 [Nakaseomyces glabratus]SLM13540.1 probable DOA4-independent degradation protein 4 [Nakaseomyces glabratus]